MEIYLSKAEEAPVTVIRVNGDLTTEEPLKSRAEQAIESGTRNLLLDLSSVPYMSSAGLRVLHVLYNLLREDRTVAGTKAIEKGIASGTYSSRHFKLLNPSKSVTKVLRMAGYDMFLEIHDDYEEAIASF